MIGKKWAKKINSQLIEEKYWCPIDKTIKYLISLVIREIEVKW